MSVEKSIREKISANLKPIHFEVINESPMHSVPKNSETHFKILVVSDLFKGLPLIKVNICVVIGIHNIHGTYNYFV